jgi:hypothetical protein
VTEATSESTIRHCEERSDEAIQSFSADHFLSIVRFPAAHKDWIASLSLAMTGGATGESVTVIARSAATKQSSLLRPIIFYRSFVFLPRMKTGLLRFRSQ